MLLSEGSKTRGILREQTILIAWVFKNVFQYVWCMAYFLKILTGSPRGSWVSSLLLPILISSRLEGTWACPITLGSHPDPHSPVSSCPTPKSSPRGWTCTYICVWKRRTWIWAHGQFLHLAGFNSHAEVQGRYQPPPVWRSPCTGSNPAILQLHLNFSVHKCFVSLRYRSAADQTATMEKVATKHKLRREHRCENGTSL